MAYSKSGDNKRKIDDEIVRKGISKDIQNEGYIKALIAACSKDTSGSKDASTSKDASKASVHTSGLEFFIVRGGAEGFLSDWYGDKDAERVVFPGAKTTEGTTPQMVFDDSGLIAVFGKDGKLINAALLRRPVSIEGLLREVTANTLYDAWDGQPVSIYRNTHFDIAYYGLMVDDKLGWYRRGRWNPKTKKYEHIWIDMHKQEATNGCIFIVGIGEHVPPYDKKHLKLLSDFEPKFILDIQHAVGAKVHSNIGILHMLNVNSK